MPWLSPLIKSFKAAGIEVEFRELQSDVRALQVALTGIVTRYEVRHLRELSNSNPYPVQYGEPLWKELEELDARGFIIPTSDIGKCRLDTIRRIYGAESLDPNRPTFNLRDYVQITSAGAEYLSLYENATKSK
jgi:hypothetical protein